jgi:outer membrane protein
MKQMVKRWAGSIAFGIVGVSFCWGIGHAADAIKVAVVDQQAVMEKSVAGKRALEELKSYSSTRQKIIETDDQELKELERNLQPDATAKLSDAEKQAKQEAFRAKLEPYQRRIQAFNQEIQAKQREMIAEYSKKIQAAALVVAEKAGYVAVLDKGTDATIRIVIYHQPGIDLTDQVVKEFDRQQK